MNDLEKLESFYIPHLREQFSVGRATLFTGAGFSMAANNLDGISLPGVTQLRRLIWSICYPGDAFDETASLQDLFDEAKVRYRDRLVREMSRALTVDSRTVPQWYALYFSMPWLAIYTLNVDNLAAAVDSRFTLPRKLRSRPAFGDAEAVVPSRKSNQLDVLHMNGTLAGVPDQVTFSTTQYAQRIAGRDAAYMRLVGDIMTRSVVFVGTSLDEPPLWQHLELRGGRGPRGMGELRPRSYLVTTSLSKPRESLLSRYNVVWLPMTAEEFAERVLTKLSAVTDVGISTLRELDDESVNFSRKPIDVGQLRPDPREKTDFLIGQEPAWSDFVAGRAVERDVDSDVWEAVTASLSSPGSPRPIAIVGTAGSGKSTCLMRVVMRMAASGKKVAWADRSVEVSSGEIVDIAHSDNAPAVIAIDDADRYGASLSGLIRDCVNAPTKPLVIFELRSQQIDRCLVGDVIRSLSINEITMPRLSDKDIDAIIEALNRENRLGRLKGMTKNERRAAFRQSADRDLLVAMYEATTGLKFKQRVVDELTELGHPANLIYALTAVATSKRFDLSKDELLLATGESSNETLNEIDRLVRRGLLIPSRSSPQRLACRHRRVGELLMEGISTSGFMPRVIAGLLTAGAAKAHASLARYARPFRILRMFLNHELLREIMSTQQCRDVYADCEALLNWDHHYWLHRGAFEVETGELALAENFLLQAKSLMPTDALVRNEWAYLLFKKAIKNVALVEAKQWAAEAYDTLVDLTYDDVPRPHPYHVLGYQGTAWSIAGIESPQRRAEYLKDLQRHLERGVRQFPHNRAIHEALEEIQRVYLRLAIR